MTTTGKAPTPVNTVSDYEHPYWCEVTRCQPHGHNEGGLHRSPGTLWQLQGDEVDFTASLVRGDDVDAAGQNHATTAVRISLTDQASCGPDGGLIQTMAEIDPSDARMLAAILTRYADLADRHDRFPIEVPAAHCGSRAVH